MMDVIRHIGGVVLGLLAVLSISNGQDQSLQVHTTSRNILSGLDSLEIRSDTVFCIHQYYSVAVPLDSIKEIRLVTDYTWPNTLTGAKIGAITGLVVGFIAADRYFGTYENSNIIDPTERALTRIFGRLMVGALYSLPATLVGALIGAIFSGSTEDVYDLSNLNHEQKLNTINSLPSTDPP